MKFSNKVGIYKIICSVNKIIYIGSTNKSFKSRYRSHVNLLRRNKHENPKLQNYWSKYGEDNFKFQIIEEFEIIDINALLDLEKKYIILFDTINKGFNICNVGKSRFGSKWSIESKNRRCGLGNPMYGKGYLRTGVNNPMYGKKLSDKHKERMSKSLTGVKKPKTSETLSKPVIQLDKFGNIINEFKSSLEVKQKLNIAISSCLNGKCKTAGGYYWKRK